MRFLFERGHRRPALADLESRAVTLWEEIASIEASIQGPGVQDTTGGYQSIRQLRQDMAQQKLVDKRTELDQVLAQIDSLRPAAAERTIGPIEHPRDLELAQLPSPSNVPPLRNLEFVERPSTDFEAQKLEAPKTNEVSSADGASSAEYDIEPAVAETPIPRLSGVEGTMVGGTLPPSNAPPLRNHAIVEQPVSESEAQALEMTRAIDVPSAAPQSALEPSAAEDRRVDDFGAWLRRETLIATFEVPEATVTGGAAGQTAEEEARAADQPGTMPEAGAPEAGVHSNPPLIAGQSSQAAHERDLGLGSPQITRDREMQAEEPRSADQPGPTPEGEAPEEGGHGNPPLMEGQISQPVHERDLGLGSPQITRDPEMQAEESRSADQPGTTPEAGAPEAGVHGNPPSWATVAVVSAMAGAAFALSIVAIVFIWSILAGLLVPRPATPASANPAPPGLSAPTPISIPPTLSAIPSLSLAALPTPAPMILEVDPASTAVDAVQPGAEPPSTTARFQRRDPSETEEAAEVESSPPEPPSSATAPPPPAPRAVVAAGSAGAVLLREQPSLSGRVIRTLPQGASVFPLDASTRADGLPWVRVRTEDGRDGWLVSTALLGVRS